MLLTRILVTIVAVFVPAALVVGVPGSAVATGAGSRSVTASPPRWQNLALNYGAFLRVVAGPDTSVHQARLIVLRQVLRTNRQFGRRVVVVSAVHRHRFAVSGVNEHACVRVPSPGVVRVRASRCPGIDVPRSRTPLQDTGRALVAFYRTMAGRDHTIYSRRSVRQLAQVVAPAPARVTRTTDRNRDGREDDARLQLTLNRHNVCVTLPLRRHGSARVTTGSCARLGPRIF